MCVLDCPGALYGTSPSSSYRFYGIYDGHRGCGAVDYTAALLPFLLFGGKRGGGKGEGEGVSCESLVGCFEKTDECFTELTKGRRLLSGSTVTGKKKKKSTFSPPFP